MAVRLANKVSFDFMGGAEFDASVTGQQHQTPISLRHTIGPLAAIGYKRAVFVAANQGDAPVTVKLVAGDTELAALEMGAGGHARQEIDLGTVQGQTQLRAVLDVETAGTGTGRYWARLDVEQPIIDGC